MVWPIASGLSSLWTELKFFFSDKQRQPPHLAEAGLGSDQSATVTQRRDSPRLDSAVADQPPWRRGVTRACGGQACLLVLGSQEHRARQMEPSSQRGQVQPGSRLSITQPSPPATCRGTSEDVSLTRLEAAVATETRAAVLLWGCTGRTHSSNTPPSLHYAQSLAQFLLGTRQVLRHLCSFSNSWPGIIKLKGTDLI